MIPPTPTFLPPGTPVFNIPETYSLWASMPYAVQSWNLMDNGVELAIKAVILIVLIIVALYILMRFLRELTGQDGRA